VDAAAPTPAGAPPSTGVRSPAICRYRSITAALDAAGAVSGPATVVLAGAAATYGVSNGEKFPLAIPPGVKLTGDDAPLDPTLRIIQLDGDMTEGVLVQDGATLSGVTIRNLSASNAATGALIMCGSGDVSLEAVHVEAATPAPATGQLAKGIRVEGGCSVTLTSVAVSGASGPGLEVERSTPGGLVVAANLALDSNGEGVRLIEGDLTLSAPTIKRSAAAGVDAHNDTAASTKLTIMDGVLHHNGDTGVLLSGNARVIIERTQVCRNSAVTPRSTQSRVVGGIYADGAPPQAFTFSGNLTHDNAGDQVLIAASGVTATWVLDGAPAAGPCAPATTNVFAGYGATDGGMGVVVVSPAKVSALFDAWNGGTRPLSGTDYQAIGANASIDVGTGGSASNFCDPPAQPTCPAAQ
jgi:hypothetical protein